jgi:peptide/nickel transport system ATP-binding protein
MSTAEHFLRVRDLHVTYAPRGAAIPAVRGVDLDLQPGETLGLAGESGCGKSSLAAALLRLLPKGTKVTGEVMLDGEDVLKMKPGRLRAVRWTDLAIVFQGALHTLNPVQRVGDQISEAIRLHSKDGRGKVSTRVGELLELVGLPARRARDYPHELSGGQRQRVLIGLALACEPRLLVADEPTTALDVMVQAQVLRLLEDLQREFGLGIIFITHDLSTLADLSDRIAVMYAGRIVEQGPAEQVFTHAAHPYTRALGAAFPVIGDPAFRMSPSGVPGDPPDPRLLPSGCPFHPRCASAIDICQSIDVELWPAGEGREAACVHASGAPPKTSLRAGPSPAPRARRTA